MTGNFYNTSSVEVLGDENTKWFKPFKKATDLRPEGIVPGRFDQSVNVV